MNTTIAVLLSAAALSGDFTDSGPKRAARRKHFNEMRLAERWKANPDTFNPGWDRGWAKPATFGNEEHNPTAQRPHPGLPERATNRLRLSWSYRMEHWAKGSNPLDRISYNNPVMP